MADVNRARYRHRRWAVIGTIVAGVCLIPHLRAQDAINPEGVASAVAGRPYSPYAERAYPTEVYFGDTHVHISVSADAGGGGTRLKPREAYRFARGEQVTSNTGQPGRAGDRL